MLSCPVCGRPVKAGRKFCGRDCYAEACKLGIVKNSGWFKPGVSSINKGRTLESWVGEERAREIKARMSVNSRNKAPQLRRLNNDPVVIQKRLASRRFHDLVVEWLATKLRAEGKRVFVLSEYIKESRIPDAIVFDGSRLVAVEVETEKVWKPSHAAIEDRLSRLNSRCGFFDRTSVVFPSVGDSVEDVGPALLAHILS